MSRTVAGGLDPGAEARSAFAPEKERLGWRPRRRRASRALRELDAQAAFLGHLIDRVAHQEVGGHQTPSD